MGLISARSSYEKVVFSRLSSQRANSSSGMDPDLYKIAAVLHQALRRRASATLCNESLEFFLPNKKIEKLCLLHILSPLESFWVYLTLPFNAKRHIMNHIRDMCMRNGNSVSTRLFESQRQLRFFFYNILYI